jgi:3'(2'), 5'-bisphosphate nucleotidase
MTDRLDRQLVFAALLDAARAAAEVVMRVYGEPDVGAEMKGPNDPVTRADKEANALLLDLLGRSLPGVAIVAEESDPSTWQDLGKHREALFVDPVDGTREFIAKNGEFCVMIGFAEEGRATVGIVVEAARGRTYGGIVGAGAFTVEADGARRPLLVSASSDIARARVAVSRFHRSKTVDAKLARLGAKELVPVGSAGLKGVRVAEAALEIYAHPSGGQVKLWDACAPDAIVEAAGGRTCDATGRVFDYRGTYAQGAGSLAANPTLHAEALRRMNG